MCLFTNQKMAKVAKKDIVCYKVVKLSSYDGIYRSPFMHTPLDKTLDGKQAYGKIVYNWGRSTYETISRDNPYEDKPKFSYIVEDGAIHSYKNLNGAKRLVKFFGKRDNEDEYHIFECIIPIGSDYYVGNENMNGGGPICYASDKVKFIKEVENVSSSKS